MPRKCPSCRTFCTRWITKFDGYNDMCGWPCSPIGVIRRGVVFAPRFRAEADWRVRQRRKRRIYGAAD